LVARKSVAQDSSLEQNLGEVSLMLTETTTKLEECTAADGQTWYDLYNWLLPLVEMWVRDARVSSWYGQHREIAEDIAHEAVMRTFRYHQRADRGEMSPIGSLKALSRVIARNYFRDWRKKDWCLVRSSQDEGEVNPFEASLLAREVADAAQIALDHLMLDSIIATVAQVVANFPQGQKAALLTDLANMSDLDGTEPTRLEQAFSNVGVQLSDYRRPRSSDPAARGRDAALRSIAYKRLKHEVKV
jgi:DNA-directed RNA polymerase specialized sigma24 family protein